MMKIILLSEAIAGSFDEGLKVILFNIIRYFKINHEVLCITSEKNETQGVDVVKLPLGKLFCSKSLKKTINNFTPDTILYIPEASHTFNSLLRARFLKMMYPKSKVAILGVQHRSYSIVQKVLIKYIKPDVLFLLSKQQKTFFEDKEIFVKVLPPAIDTGRFCPIDSEQKTILRKKYHIPYEKKVVLHVGHIKESRNLNCFLSVNKLPNVQVVIVGSTTTKQDQGLADALRKDGIIVIDSYQPKMEELYQLSDMYVFPVFRNDAAIDMPLSVLEAMACNLLIITARFGGLIDYFKEDDDFRYFNSSDELIKIIENINYEDVKNNIKVKNFTWDRVTHEIMETFEKV